MIYVEKKDLQDVITLMEKKEVERVERWNPWDKKEIREKWG